jgi:hypothetical protein
MFVDALQRRGSRALVIPKLRRFWFRFDDLPKFAPVRLGCGVTARDYDDAIDILGSTVFRGQTMPTIASVTDDVDISTLDRGHVIPNMEVPVFRGVWFPKGYLGSHEPVST